jgi:hypothetical protein
MINLSVIGYYLLHHKSKNQIQAKFCLVSGNVALCPLTVDTRVLLVPWLSKPEDIC